MINEKICIDRLLRTPKDRIMAAKRAVAENPENYPDYAPSTISPLGLALLTDKKWPVGREISVYFMQGSATQKRRVETYLRVIEQYANLKFKVTTNPKSDCRIGFTLGDGSWSYLGLDNLQIPFSERTLNFGWLYDDSDEREYSSVCLHELLHLSNFYHEHQSPVSGMDWIRENVIRDLSGPPNNWTIEDIEHNVFMRYDKTISQYSEFDPLSIMAYNMPENWTRSRISIPWNYELSGTDKKYLTKFYPFSDLSTSGKPRRLNLPKGITKQLNLILSPDEAGKYIVGTNPDLDSWISLILPNNDHIFSKNPIEVILPAGKTIVKLRNDTRDGKYDVSVKKAP